VSGADVLRVFQVPLPILIPPNILYLFIFLSSTLYSLSAECAVNNKHKKDMSASIMQTECDAE
jgi:hypothetical protein